MVWKKSLHKKNQENTYRHSTQKGDVMIPYVFKQQSNIRYLRITINDSNQVILKAPISCSKKKALQFLKSQAEWVVDNLKKIPPKRVLSQYLRAKPFISANGVRLNLELCKSVIHSQWVVDYAKEQIIFMVKESEDTELEIKQLLKKFAKQVLTERAELLSYKMKLSLEKITIRDQRTMWGSCSNKSTLSLNWRLILLESELQDHIILHELAHLTHMNHSKNFYALLEEYDPNSTVNDHRISKLSPEIMQLGR